jgi:transposase
MDTPTRKAYPSDLSDAQWHLIEPLLPSARPQGAVGRPNDYSRREIVNAILYLVRTGCQWRYLPHDLPPYTLVSTYFHQWQQNGVLDRVHDSLRHQVRQQAGKEPTPSVVIVDSQSVKTTEKGGLPTLKKLSAMTRAKRSRAVSAISSWTHSV